MSDENKSQVPVRSKGGNCGFSPFPKSSEDIWAYPGRGERMACTIVRNRTIRQLMAYRKLRIALGEQSFREILVEGLDILSRSQTITTPAGWLYDFIAKEVCDD